MSDQEDVPAARGGSSSRGRPRHDDDRGHPWNRRDFIPPDDPGWARCTVKKHEEFKRRTPLMTSLVLLSISLSVLCGKRTGTVFLIFSLSLRSFLFEVSNVEGYSHGGLVTHNLSMLPGLAFFSFCNQLASARLVIRRAVEMESLQFVGCSWFIGLIGLGFRFTQNKSTSTELCALPCPSPVSSSTRLDAPGVHSLAL